MVVVGVRFEFTVRVMAISRFKVLVFCECGLGAPCECRLG